MATAAARALSSSLAGFAKRVPFLHFGELHLEERPHLLGQGGTAKVFKGVHKGKDIAIKMVYVMELTPTIIENFMLEARTLAAFNHPNIVSLRGVCVLPPAFLIVLEFMNRGSLDQFLRSLHGLALRWPEKLMMIRDCARAVACLHGMKPEPLLHCDLKSLNFLVSLDELSGHLTVKLSDLELVRGTEGGSQLFNSQSASDLRPLINAQTHEPVPITEEDFGLDRRTFSTFNWTAPELLAGDDYTLHSDVYALAMVAWEVLSPGHVPFEKLAMTDAINTAGALLIQKHTQLVGSHTTYRLSNLSNADANDELSSPNDTSMPLLATQTTRTPHHLLDTVASTEKIIENLVASPGPRRAMDRGVLHWDEYDAGKRNDTQRLARTDITSELEGKLDKPAWIELVRAGRFTQAIHMQTNWCLVDTGVRPILPDDTPTV